mgnify:CR=1 FL=1
MADPQAPLPSSISGLEAHPLSGRQLALYTELAREDKRLADIYRGSIVVLGDETNPDRLALSAHGLRELMEKIARYRDVEVKSREGGSLTDQANRLEDQWKGATNSGNFSNGEWKGDIDSPLRTFLGHVAIFFQWKRTNRPRRREAAAEVLRRMEKSGTSLPPRLREMNAKTWLEMRDYFENISHHNDRSHPDEFGEWMGALENFILERLQPRTFEDDDAIDRLLREAGGRR